MSKWKKGGTRFPFRPADEPRPRVRERLHSTTDGRPSRIAGPQSPADERSAVKRGERATQRVSGRHPGR